jgi:holliday junction DNA helicase RuvA
MIAHLNGRLASTGADHAVIDVNGVGYLVGASARTLAALGALGEAVTVHTEMLVSEDSIRLMGFASAEERDWFRLLTSVQGVGAKVALAVLGTLSPTDLANAIALRDKAAVARTPGVGPKVAERIVTELKDKAPALAMQRSAEAGERISGLQAPRPAEADAISALVKLGYSPMAAGEAVARAGQNLGDAAALDALIRESLRQLARAV